jgi:hypothetical protein
MKEVPKDLIKRSLQDSYSYMEYRELVSRLAENGKSTGAEQSDLLAKYTQLNYARMRRWDRTLKLSEEQILKIKRLSKPITFLVLTESWCGDAASSVPVFQKIAQASDKIKLRIILRDENLDLMGNYLTKNALSIPKLILWDLNSEKVLADWGPRPKPATNLVDAFKEEHGQLTPEFRESLQMWYNKDKGKSIQQEVVSLLPLE